MAEQTSILAFREFQSKRISECVAMRNRIYLLIKEHGNMTDREICLFFSSLDLQNMQPKVRRHELVYGIKGKNGVERVKPRLILVGKRRCNITGKMAKAWGCK